MRAGDLRAALDRLEARYGAPAPPPTRDPFGLVLLENLSYPADDARAARAWHALEGGVGVTPREVAAAPERALRAAAAEGGIFPELRAGRLRESARLVLEEHGGDLAAALRAAPSKASRVLRAFPVVGEPGADRILMFAGAAPVLGLDSNAVRTLLRLGYGTAGGSFARDYRSARDAAARRLDGAPGERARAFLLLKRHGKETCRRSDPACGGCPLRGACPFARSREPARSRERRPR